MRLTLALAVALAAGNSSARADTPRDEALALAPTDFALVAVGQNLRDHAKRVAESPFAQWFPTTALGKQLLDSPEIKNLTEGLAPLFAFLGVKPEEVLDDILGDAVVFAYTPAPPDKPKGERSVILIRPRKPDLLRGVLDKLNDGQKASGELRALVEHKHAGGVYFERQMADGEPSFYGFRGDVFAYTQSEADIKAVLERELPAKDKAPVLVDRLRKLGVADAAAVLLVNPRLLDAEVAAKVKAAQGGQKAILAKFAEVWSAIDAAALSVSLDAGAEVGVSLQFTPAKLPAGVKGFLATARTPSALWAAIPDDALLAAAGRAKVRDVWELLATLKPDADGPSLAAILEQAVGPVVGKDKLPGLIDALGPDSGFWVLPPAKGQSVPVVVGAVKIDDAGPKGAETAKSLAQSVEFGFQVLRVGYNAKHKDQIDLTEEKDGEVVIKSLSGGMFPAGVRPSFALKGGYLVLATSPDAI
ncbi:MAG: hypothetical protein K2V38_02415, partial [Gemmataceae bacterium]|nr:hypothetical protein [Gemmataceae bacterium]